MLLRTGNQDYNLDFPAELEGIRNTIHVWYLRKFMRDVPDMIPLMELRIDKNKRLIEEPKVIVDRKMKKVRRKTVKLVLV